MARKNPSMLSVPKMDKHEQMCDDMSSAVGALRDKIRKPWNSNGDKLLPKGLVSETPEKKAARSHIEKLHSAFRAEK